MKHAAKLTIILSLCASCLHAAEHAATGVVLKTDPAHRSLLISCQAMPGYMSAMEMPFKVSSANVLASIQPGATIHFTIVPRGKALYAENIRALVNFEPEPADAGALTALRDATDPAAAAKVLSIGEAVPDFALTDQAEKKIRLSQFRGKVVALTFGYSRCPNPNYCLRLSNNLAHVESRFHAQAGRDLIFITIAIDPEYDRGDMLKRYAASFKANPQTWHFLTGTVPQIKQVAALFGMDFWSSEGTLTHTLHTVVIDRDGKLAANLEGNQFTAQQLGDLVKTVMDRPK